MLEMLISEGLNDSLQLAALEALMYVNGTTRIACITPFDSFIYHLKGPPKSSRGGGVLSYLSYNSTNSGIPRPINRDVAIHKLLPNAPCLSWLLPCR